MTHSIYNLFLKNRGVASLMYLFVEKGVKMMGILIIGEGIASFFFRNRRGSYTVKFRNRFPKGVSYFFVLYALHHQLIEQIAD